MKQSAHFWICDTFAGLHSFLIYINEGQSFGVSVRPKAQFS